ncbi:MAG TPA: hypothetical protein VMZ29_13860 [Candidatus Bathyarchaeia archaeon]|nr:hypothetical protein [Candidatus Bathyarchaeia archaeon]
MPGISMILGDLFDNKIIADLKYEKYYDIEFFLESKDNTIIISKYNGYPYEIYNFDEKIVILEGMIYNKTEKEINDELSEIINTINEKGNYKNKIKKFIESSSGDYIIVIHSKTDNATYVFNDQWGRLQCFYHSEKNKFIFSREIKFILHYFKNIRYSKIGLLEHLAIRYTFGSNTIFSDIKRMLPGYLLIYENQTFVEEEILPLNFNFEPLDFKLKKDYIQEAARILSESAKLQLSKLNQYTKCADLSGGYDSRIVYSITRQLDNTVRPVSIDLITGSEKIIAEKIAEVYNDKLVIIQPEREFDFDNTQNLLYKTDGLVDGRITAGCYPNRQFLRKEFPEPIANFMGFGGEFLRHPKKQKRFHKNILDIIEIDSFPMYISKTSIKSFCSCLDLNENEIKKYWLDYFQSNYNEKRIEDIIVHYYFEYYRIFVGQGEDRSRKHIWTVNPMMSNDWLIFATKKIPRNYCDYQFFEELLNNIDQNISINKIPVFGGNFKKSKIYNFIISNKFLINVGKIYTGLKWKIKLSKDNERKEMINEILSLYNESKSIQKNFNLKEVINITKREFGPNNWFIWQLFSLFLYMNKIEKKFEKN